MRSSLTLPSGVLPAAVVADANILLSATIDGRALDVLRERRAPICWATPEVYAEAAEYLPIVGNRKGLNVERLLRELQLLPVTVVQPETYLPFQEEARRRMAARDSDDWPTVALALALDFPIWSQDKDLAASELTVYTTGRLLDALHDEAAVTDDNG